MRFEERDSTTSQEAAPVEATSIQSKPLNIQIKISLDDVSEELAKSRKSSPTAGEIKGDFGRQLGDQFIKATDERLTSEMKGDIEVIQLEISVSKFLTIPYLRCKFFLKYPKEEPEEYAIRTKCKLVEEIYRDKEVENKLSELGLTLQYIDPAFIQPALARIKPIYITESRRKEHFYQHNDLVGFNASEDSQDAFDELASAIAVFCSSYQRALEKFSLVKPKRQEESSN